MYYLFIVNGVSIANTKSETQLVSNEGDEAIQAAISNNDEIRTVPDDGNSIKKWFECKVCNKPFKWSCDLQRHKLMHGNERPFKCHVCNKTFKRPDDLKKHKLTHGNERTFKCAMCDEAFKQCRYLKDHIKIHTDIEKILKCNVCGKVLKCYSNLLRHKLMHGNVRPHKCHVCNKTFKGSSNLKRHNLTHGNVRLFECEMCDWKFTQKCNLNRHMKVHKSSDKKLYSTVSSSVISISDIIETEISIRGIITIAGL
ncbi:unnamed protein product [Cercopithifilaria johnstoni]|uniref:C2H2-type domain-containing protein n=1 Tax=Cercopithifilaria johnstoni TaxID=2874296 RepID=A0A8J2PUJ7_9BILA|nr:unnamed protein product [Cercopithifilaria johnstoni]